MTLSTKENDQTSILIVDDRKENLLALEAWLEDFDLNIVKATSGNEALERLLSEDFALVLMDVQMPGMDGFETAELMRGTERARKIPIIFVTAISKEDKHIFKGYKSGAVDYIFKPLDPHILRSKVDVFIGIYQQNKELENKIVELRQANEKIKHLSIIDPLTGCFNRGYFNMNLPKEVKRAMRYNTAMSLVLIDIDHFKKVNDTYGHQCGDKTLKVFADILQSLTRKNVDWVSRYGGEEFALILPETDMACAITAAEKLRKSIVETSVSYKDHRINISASFGVAGLDLFITDPDKAIEELIHTADQRMYDAKNQGRNRVVGGK